MCLIIHKPAGNRIPKDLLKAAFLHCADGLGLMGFGAEPGALIVRRGAYSLQELEALESQHAEHEYVLHLRRRTRGGSGPENLHPFTIAPGLYLMHNGTIPLPARLPDRSDSWHLATDILRPLHQRHPGLLLDNAFRQVVELALTPQNKLAVLDAAQRRIVIFNRDHGVELDGLWLSNTRWIDGAHFPLASPPQPQARALIPGQVSFA